MSSYHQSAKSLQLVLFFRKRISLVSHRKTNTLKWNGIGVCEAISVSGLLRGRQEAMDPGHLGSTLGMAIGPRSFLVDCKSETQQEVEVGYEP